MPIIDSARSPYRFDVPTELMANGCEVKRIDDAVRMQEIPGSRKAGAASLERGRRESEDPQGQPRVHLAANARVMTALEKSERPVLLPIVERHPLLAMSSRRL
jgi:hypothetical protein